MGENKKTQLTTISKARTYEEIAEFWDTHSLADGHLLKAGHPFIICHSDEGGISCLQAIDSDQSRNDKI